MHQKQATDEAYRQRTRELRRDMTIAETALWAQLRAHRLAGLHFRRQHRVGRFIVDFYCASARLVVEVDGSIHAIQTEHDAERGAILNAQNIRVLRLSNERVMTDLVGCLAEIVATAEAVETL